MPRILTQSILAKASRGEFVPQDPADEPASELLKRIREERQKQEAESRPGRRDSRRGGNPAIPTQEIKTNGNKGGPHRVKPVVMDRL